MELPYHGNIIKIEKLWKKKQNKYITIKALDKWESVDLRETNTFIDKVEYLLRG